MQLHSAPLGAALLYSVHCSPHPSSPVPAHMCFQFCRRLLNPKQHGGDGCFSHPTMSWKTCSTQLYAPQLCVVPRLKQEQAATLVPMHHLEELMSNPRHAVRGCTRRLEPGCSHLEYSLPTQQHAHRLPACQGRFSHFPLNLNLNLGRQKINEV